MSKSILYIYNAQQDITDDTSSTSIHASDQDIGSADNNNDVKESQSIDINSINLNNHASNDCESSSDSDNIATRVRAKNSKAHQKHMNINPEGTSLLLT
jgi:hypothetical protein